MGIGTSFVKRNSIASHGLAAEGVGGNAAQNQCRAHCSRGGRLSPPIEKIMLFAQNRFF